MISGVFFAWLAFPTFGRVDKMSQSRRTVDALTIVVPLFGNAEEMMGAGMPHLCHYSRPIKLILSVASGSRLTCPE